jgi:hypothetical protein
MRYWIASLCFLLLASCEQQQVPQTTERKLVSESVSYEDPDEHRRFKDALDEANVPYETYVNEKGKEFVRWRPEVRGTVQAVQAKVFGPDLPAGRNIHFEGDMGALLKSWLAENDIPFTVIVNRGKEYVVWDETDNERVRSWESFPSYYDNPPISSSNKQLQPTP